MNNVIYNKNGEKIFFLSIEGIDGSGKETQSKELKKRLEEVGLKVLAISFPFYHTPTGKIVGGAFQGKPEICQSFFEDSTKVDPKVASLYYAADRVANIPKFEETDYDVVIFDRFAFSSMAYQGAKYDNLEERHCLYNFIERLEFGVCELPRPNQTILLRVDPEISLRLIKERNKLDHHEKNGDYIRNSAMVYEELATLFGFSVINCSENGQMRTIDDVSDQLYDVVVYLLDEFFGQ